MRRGIALAIGGGLMVSTFVGCKREKEPAKPTTPASEPAAAVTPGTQGAPPVVSPDVALPAPLAVSVADLKWGPGPDALPPGTQIAVLEGTPPFADEKSFTIALKLPKNYKIPPHQHLVTERVTLLEGAISFGHGPKLDPAAAKQLHQGGLFVVPNDHTHFAMTTADEAVVMLQGVGPWGIFYVDPRTDPRPKPVEKPKGFVSRFDAKVRPITVEASEVAYSPAPPGMLPRGAQMAVLEGEPAKNQNFVMRIKVPDGYRFPVHSHSITDRVVVIAGSMMFGLGDTMQADAMKELKPGSVVLIPAGIKHYAQAKGETVIQISGTGPYDIRWANPDEDPARSAPQATAK